MSKLTNAFRSFSICSIALEKSTGRQARIMNKFLGGSSKKRSWYPVKEVSATSLPQVVQPSRGERNSRRITVLNKLFMKYVSDLLTTGEIDPAASPLGIEISKVKISPDFSVLKVYWVAKGTSSDNKVECILSNHAGKLRHELTQLRVIGNVPSILFVKDKSLSKIAEVDGILSRADFGEDFVPTDPTLSLLSNLTLSSKLPQHLEEKILSEDGGLPETPVPSMQSNALGLNYDVIMQKIRLSMNKAKAPHRSPAAIYSINVELHSDEETNLTNLPGKDSVEGQETEINVDNSELKKFFAKRLALQSKIMKTPKNYDPGTELLLTQNDSPDDEEDYDDFDLLSNAQRIKELEIEVDDNFEEIEDDFKSQLYEDGKFK